MVNSHQKLQRGVFAGAFVMGAVAMFATARASTVPSDWNTTPITDGAYLESFETLPAWVTDDSVVTNDFPSMSGADFPARSNDWFASSTKVLELDTQGGVLTNELAYSGPADVSFADKPVYVDMRVYFGAYEGTPSEESLAGAKLAIYATPTTPKLVVVHADGAYTNSTALDTNEWHQLTIKLYTNAFDVLLNDEAVVTGLTPRDNDADNVLQSVDFYGTKGDTVTGGYIDELYVSHGSPARTITGAVPALPTEPAGPTDAEKDLLRQWLSLQPGFKTDSSFTANLSQLSQSYLLDELHMSGNAVVPNNIDFGVSKIDMTSPTYLLVTLKLQVDSANKVGTINGKVQLQGKTTKAGAWTTLEGAITPTLAEFDANGEATYPFTIPAGGYKFFQALIVQ